MAATAAAGAVSGCADFARVTGITPTPLDTTSPVSAQVAAATHTHYPMPSFRDVPPKPNGIPPARVFANRVASNDKAREALATWVAENPPMQPLDANATEAFAASERARIPASELVPPTPVGSEEYAARLRALATPPPPPR
jgi:hypothetical protein